MSNSASRDDRVDVRLPAAVKRLLMRAAAYNGVSLSSFIVASAVQRAQQMVTEQEVLELAPHDWRNFLARLDKAGRRRPRLERAVRRYSKRRGR
jgi:uncharacterized protein (DUF1778 family)